AGRWALDQPRYQGSVRSRERRCGLPEISPGGGFDAVVAVAQIDLVQIGLEYLRLLNPALESDRDERLLHLATERAIAVERELTAELLGDRAAALPWLSVAQVDERCARNRDNVEAVMVEKATILGRKHGRDHYARDPIERHAGAILSCERVHHVVVAVE